MKTILIILIALAVIAGAIYIATKYFGVFNDTDKDGIPDEIEDKVEDVKKTVKVVKARAKRVKQELNDVVESAKDVVKQSKDVIDAVKGAPRKGNPEW